MAVNTWTYFSIGVAQLDCNVPLELVLKSDGQNTRDSFDNGGFSVSDMTDGPDVDCSLISASVSELGASGG